MPKKNFVRTGHNNVGTINVMNLLQACENDIYTPGIIQASCNRIPLVQWYFIVEIIPQHVEKNPHFWLLKLVGVSICLASALSKSTGLNYWRSEHPLSVKKKVVSFPGIDSIQIFPTLFIADSKYFRYAYICCSAGQRQQQYFTYMKVPVVNIIGGIITIFLLTGYYLSRRFIKIEVLLSGFIKYHQVSPVKLKKFVYLLKRKWYRYPCVPHDL